MKFLKQYFFESQEPMSMSEAIFEIEKHLHQHDGRVHFYYAKILEKLNIENHYLHKIIKLLEKGYEKKDPLSMMLYAQYLHVESSPFFHPVKAYQVFLEAQSMWMKLVREKDPFACQLYGIFLYKGLLMKKNNQEAIRYIEIAAKHTLLESYDTLFQLYQQKGDFYNQEMSQSYLSLGVQASDPLLLFKKAMLHLAKKEEFEAIYYLQKSADLDLSHASFALANIYIKQKEHEKAFFYMEKAATFDHPHAIYMLSLAYANGKGVIKDLDQSRFYLEKGASMQHVVSMNQLAMTLMKETPKDHQRIYDLLYQANLKKDPLATYNLAMMYHLGDGLYQDDVKAFKLLDSIKQTQLPMVLYQLGVMLVEGKGTSKNEPLGIQYVKKASEKKFKLATEYLKHLESKKNQVTFYA